MKDLPDPTQQRRYSRRSTVTSLLSESMLQGNSAHHNDAIVTRTGSITEDESPSIVVENLSASWNGKVWDHTV